MSKRGKRSTKPTPALAAKVTPLAEQDKLSFLRQHITTATLTAIIGGLISLATVCAVFLYNARKSMRDIQDPMRQSLEDDRDQINLSKQFTDRADDVVTRNNATALEYFSHHTWYKPHYYGDPKLRREALATSALAIQQADGDLGSISVYPDQATLIPKVYATAAMNDLRSDVAVWNALTALTEAHTPADEQKAFDVLVNKWSDFGGALSSYVNSRSAVANSLRRKQLDEKRIYEKQLADFHGLLRKDALATLGLGISGTAFLVILGFILWPVTK